MVWGEMSYNKHTYSPNEQLEPEQIDDESVVNIYSEGEVFNEFDEAMSLVFD